MYGIFDMKLLGRKHCVKVNGGISQFMDVVICIPQGYIRLYITLVIY